jgi:hypothetical protein
MPRPVQFRLLKETHLKQIRERLTYANVMSSIAVFLVLGGATAIAAGQLGRNTVGTKQLKKNAVTAAKIKKGAVNGAKLADGSVTGTKLADGSVTGTKLADGAVSEGKLGPDAVTEAKIKNGAVGTAKLGDNSVSTAKIQNGAITGEKLASGAVTGADINAGSTPFSQVVARLRNAGPINMQSSTSNPLGSYTQPAGEDDIYLGGIEVTFLASCAQPRSATAFLTLDPENPFAAENLVGLGTITDKNAGTVTKHLEFGDYGIAGAGGLHRMGLASPQSHTFYVFPAGASCNSGSGITGSNLAVDVIGTK